MKISEAPKVPVCYQPSGETKYFPEGTGLSEIADAFNVKLKAPVVGAMVNNELKELSFRVYRPKTVRFVDLTNKDGMRMYVRGLYYVLMKAARELYPDAELRIDHSVSNGYFCELIGKDMKNDIQTVSDIENRMRKIIAADIPFVRKEIRNEEAIRIFEEYNFTEKARLFKQSPALYTSVYELDGMLDYFYGFLVPSTGYLQEFDLIQIYDGMLLRIPDRNNPKQLKKIVRQDKMFEIMQEHKEWVRILRAENVGRVNEQVLEGKHGELVKLAEALHEKRIAEIADNIKKHPKVRLILVSGPSSSGKTTFSKRLSIQLRVAGMRPVLISLDNYFVNREDTPLDENGDYDFESLEALDYTLFNKNINELQAGKKVELPRFDFQSGKRYYKGDYLQTDKDTLIIAEGIHALNPKLTRKIEENIKFKVYVSALTQIGIDGHNRIPTTDNRLLRRIVRDFQFRGYSAKETLQRWPSVRRGEDRNIFPYQEHADIMFNSALMYELGVLKQHAEPLLKSVQQNVPEYAEAKRLLKFLSYFKDIPDNEIPPTSILREFLGSSSFKYH